MLSYNIKGHVLTDIYENNSLDSNKLKITILAAGFESAPPL
jgi:hypothetical protein